jgi:hypothetical protein
LKTRDGSLKADLYFVGENCGGGGTGWVLFGPTVPTGSWASQVAEIGQAASPAGCGRLSAAYTQYRLEQVPIPFIIDGQQQILSLPTIISEHYNGKDPTTAIMLERFYFARNWGKVRWGRWDKRGNPRAGLAQECPAIPTWGSAPPFAGAIMTDCRNWTNIITAAGATRGPLEAAPARYFLDLRVRLGMAVTPRIRRLIEQVADQGAADLVTLRLQRRRQAAHAQKVDSILGRRALTPAANLIFFQRESAIFV